MTIKHLILPGGGINGIKTLGILYKLSELNVFNIENIESIYATSIGSFIAVLIALKFSWDYIIDYIIKRPWHETVNFSFSNVVSIFTNKGLYDKNFFEIFFKPFFDAKEIALDITMLDFFNLTQIDLHFFTLNLNQFVIVDLNKDTYPDLPLLTAVHMTSALPILLSPVYYKDEYYVDGVLGANYPFQYLKSQTVDESEILGIFNDSSSSTSQHSIDETATIFDYFVFFLNKLIQNISLKQKDVKSGIANEIICETREFSLTALQIAISSESERQTLLDSGITTAETWYNSLSSSNHILISKSDGSNN
jgi:predicted acylesterase/phospholipase RssA